MLCLAEHLPLEQGLRPSDVSSLATSGVARRASSIRTRIKTTALMFSSPSVVILAEHLPLEQGLRLSYILGIFYFDTTRRASSIRTRIKTPWSSNSSVRLPSLAEHLPLEQGLRLFSAVLGDERVVLAEHLPLEQGLRPTYSAAGKEELTTRRASSIRTRMLRREVGTNNKRRLLCQQSPLIGIRLALIQRTHEPCVPTKGYSSSYSYRFDITRRVTIL